MTFFFFVFSCNYMYALANMSWHMTKPIKWPVRPAKTQISLGIRPVWSESLLSAWRNIGPLTTYWVHSEDSDQTGQMPRLIWVFAGRTCHFVGFLVWQLNYNVRRTEICNILFFVAFELWGIPIKEIKFKLKFNYSMIYFSNPSVKTYSNSLMSLETLFKQTNTVKRGLEWGLCQE